MCIDDPVTKTPRPFSLWVGVGDSFAVGVPGRVQPVPPPAFAIVRIGQQSLDQSFPGPGCGVVQESLLLDQGGWHAEQVEGRASQQRQFLRGWSERVTRGFQPGLHEAVQRVADFEGLLHAWRFWLLDRLEGPELEIEWSELESSSQRLGLGPGRFGSRGDPAADHGDLLRGQLLAVLSGRHFAGGHALDQCARPGFAHHDRGAGLPAGNQESLQTQVQSSLDFVRLTVALKAVCFKNSTDVLFKSQSGPGGRNGSRGQSQPEDGDREVSHRGNRGRKWLEAGACRRVGMTRIVRVICNDS